MASQIILRQLEEKQQRHDMLLAMLQTLSHENTPLWARVGTRGMMAGMLRFAVT